MTKKELRHHERMEKRRKYISKSHIITAPITFLFLYFYYLLLHLIHSMFMCIYVYISVHIATICIYTRYQHINMLFCYLALQQSVYVYDYENFDLRRWLFSKRNTWTWTEL